VIEALLWGFGAALSLLIGAVIAVTRPPGTRLLGAVMGFGAGVLLSAVSFELVSKSVAATGDLQGAAWGLFAGAATFSVGDWFISRAGYAERKDIGGEAPTGSGLSIVLGALLDGIPESAVLGLTLLQTGEIGTSMLVAVFVSNLPEGIAATSGLRAGGWSPARCYALWAGIAVASGLSAMIGYALLDGASSYVLAFIFAFAAGAILTMLSTSMMPEAYEHAGRLVGVLTVLGFAVAFTITWLDVGA
jgi:zinc transporter, ZIP family